MAEAREDIYFSLVVLGYGSGKSLVPLVEKLHRMFSLHRFPWEIILVGNYLEGKLDDTPAVVKELSERLPHVKCVTLKKLGMAGWDLRTGMDMAQGKYVGFIDGDGQMPLEAVVACLAKAGAEQLDVVKTYRVVREDGVYRRLVSWIFNGMFRVLFKMKVRDVNSNPKIFLRSQYQRMVLKSDDWFIDAEMMVQAKELGLSIGEIPMHFNELTDRASFVKFSTLYEFVSNMFRYRFGRARFGAMPKLGEVKEP